MYGKVVKLFRKPSEDPDPVCDDCDEDDDRYMKKIMGMVIMEGDPGVITVGDPGGLVSESLSEQLTWNKVNSQKSC